jgi:hypothetical protein
MIPMVTNVWATPTSLAVEVVHQGVAKVAPIRAPPPNPMMAMPAVPAMTSLPWLGYCWLV